MKNTDVIIVGGGIAGLTAALHLQRKGLEVKLLEATDRVGGRVKTDEVDGYRLDRGFQVLLTAYPEAKRFLDYTALDLRNFKPGAIISSEQGRQLVGDPMRWLGSTIGTVFNSVGTLSDKFKILALRNRLKGMSINDIFVQEETTTLSALKQYGFSEAMIQQFFHPFLSGIFLETQLSTSRRMFDFVFKMFSEGNTALPAKGIEVIPQQLAANIHPNTILCHQEVTHIESGQVTTTKGETFKAKKIIIATEATGLVKKWRSKTKTDHHSTTTLYFAAEAPIFKYPILALNPNQDRLVNNFCDLSALSPHFAPEGKRLISVTVVGKASRAEDQLVNAVKAALKRRLGEVVTNWEHIKTYHIDYALPDATSIKNNLKLSDVKIDHHLYVCGDHLMNGSLNAAMKSGRIVANMVADELN